MSWPQAPRAAAAAALLALGFGALSACGGGGSGGSPPPPAASNVAPLIVDAGPTALGINLPSVSVTICAPGTSSCQTIDHILVDTGSTGLRILAEVLSPSVALPAAQTAAGDPMYECMVFADGYSWGSVRTADVQLADGKASSLAVQLIGDPAQPVAPADCSSGHGPPENTVASFGSNGVLGLNVFQQDCGSECVSVANPNGTGFYYGCPTGGCVGTTVSLSAQVWNPVARFPSNNNGIAIVLPAINREGQLSASGSLILGIDTQSNNQLGAAAVLPVNPLTGYFSTTYNNQSYSQSYIDSGSIAYYFYDSRMAVCPVNTALYCPPAIQMLNATNQGVGGAPSTVAFNVINADLFLGASSQFTAYSDIAGPNPVGVFDWGLPFFYGRTVFVGFENSSASQTAGPFVAYR